jgi:ABC-type phosphate/phosphonate transport system substrate-binding protein
MPLLVAGCQTTGLRFLNLVGLTHKPVAVALVSKNEASPVLNVVGALNPFPAYVALQEAMAKGLDRPVGVEPCFAPQVEPGLRSGWYDLAVISPPQWAGFENRTDLRVVVAPVDQRDRIVRCAFLVVAADSPIRAVEELRGKSVAFGPPEDTLTHYAALALLRRQGVTTADLKLELLPIPGSLKHIADGRGLALSVISGGSAAGFIDEADFESLPVQGSGDSDPAQSKLRVVDRTLALPQRLIVASPSLDEHTVHRIRTLLVEMDRTNPSALKPLDVKAYRVPSAEDVERCVTLEPVVRGTGVSTRPAEP